MAKKSFTGFVDLNSKIIKPLSVEDFNFLITGFEDGTKVTVTIESFIREKSLSQNALFHKYIDLISKETGDDKKDLKIEMKQRFGVVKDNGELKSTANYTSEEMSKLIDGTWNFGVTFLGMNLPTPEEYKHKNLK